MNFCYDTCIIDGSKTCCHECARNSWCEERCDLDPKNCGSAEAVEPASTEETQMTLLVKQYMTTFQKIAEIERVKAQIEDAEKDMKKTLMSAMEKYGVKVLDAGFLKITYVASTSSTAVDTTKLKKMYPAIAAECSKKSEKAAYVKITMNDKKKGGEQ